MQKKPAGIFGTLLFSIQISQQLLFQQYLIPALVDCLNFKKRNIYTIFAEKSRPAFSELFCSSFCFFATAFMYLRFLLFNDMMCWHFWPYKINEKKYLQKFCRKKPAGIFGTFFFSIWILQQLLCQQYKCRHFWPYKIDINKYLHKFCRKKPAGIFGLFFFSIRILQQLLCQQYKCRHFLTFQTAKKKEISTQFLQKKAGWHFRNFFLLHSDFATTLMSSI